MNGRTWVLGGFILLVSAELLGSAVQADSFNMKLGAWEIQSTIATSGTLIPPDVLAKMPPERRAQFEESMKARAAHPKTHTNKECLTQEDIEQNRIIKEEDDDDDDHLHCPTKVSSKSPTKLVIERTCPPPRASSSQMVMEAKTPENLIGSIDMTRAGAGKVHVDIKGHWLGASCAGIKE